LKCFLVAKITENLSGFKRYFSSFVSNSRFVRLEVVIVAAVVAVLKSILLFSSSKTVSYVIEWSLCFGFTIISSSKLFSSRHCSGIVTMFMMKHSYRAKINKLTCLVHFHPIVGDLKHFEAIITGFPNYNLIFRSRHQSDKAFISVHHINPFCERVGASVIGPLA
jgi:hypothetical protein